MNELNLPYASYAATGEQCREADRLTIEKLGVDGFTLMETAGMQAAEWIGEKAERGSSGLFICGNGNNGGDGLVAARYLAIVHQHTCHILFPAFDKPFSEDARRNLEILKKLAGLKSIDINFHYSLDEIGNFEPDYIVDALLGTGLTSDLRAPFDQVVRKINSSSRPVFSFDIPSGLHTDTGQPMPEAVRATHTLTFGTEKLGFYLDQGPDHTGETHLFNLSFPVDYRPAYTALLRPEIIGQLPSVERKAEHKYSGRVLYLLAGSRGLTGAAILAASAGWKTGVGAVILITPGALMEIYEKNLPDVIKTSVSSGKEDRFQTSHLKETLKILNRKKGALLIGPGIGRDKSTLEFATRILEQFEGPAVIDADALYADPFARPNSETIRVLTPHPGELSHLTQTSGQSDFERLQAVTQLAEVKQATIVSKGYPTFVGTPQKENYLTTYDTRLFARAGFGDILSGAIAGNLAITDNEVLSIARALLDGYHRAIEIKNRQQSPPEPKDLL